MPDVHGGPSAGAMRVAGTRKGRNDSGGQQSRCARPRTRQERRPVFALYASFAIVRQPQEISAGLATLEISEASGVHPPLVSAWKILELVSAATRQSWKALFKEISDAARSGAEPAYRASASLK